MSTAFCELVKRFVGLFRHIIKLISILLQKRPALYAGAIKKHGKTLNTCTGFTNCTKIRVNHPGGHASFQRGVYFGQKRFNCLMYQILTAPVGLMLSIYGLENGSQYEATLYKKSQW